MLAVPPTPPTSDFSRFQHIELQARDHSSTLLIMYTDQEDLTDCELVEEGECLLTVTSDYIRTPHWIIPKTFHFFGKLPWELRALIWAHSLDPERIVPVSTDTHDREIDPDDYSEDNDKHAVDMREIDRELNNTYGDWDTFLARERTYGLQQLESFGFTSSKAQPRLRTAGEAEVLAHRKWVEATVTEVNPGCPVPAALHVCRESRSLMVSWGFELAFSTYEHPAKTWFNFNTDTLYLEYTNIGITDTSDLEVLDGGASKMGQCPPRDLERVKKLALRIWDYDYGGHLPTEVHEIVQQFGNLKELLIVDSDWHETTEGSPTVRSRAGRGPCVAMDLGNEELWGHRFEAGGDCYIHGYRLFDRAFTSRSLLDLANDFENRLRSQKDPVVSRWVKKQPIKTSWSIPSARFVVLLAESDVQNVYKSRQRYREHVKNQYWTRVQWRENHNLNLFYSGQEISDDNCPCYHDEYDDISCLLNAKVALCPEDSDPYSPRARSWEIFGGQQAMAEMDSWPWQRPTWGGI